MSASETKNAHIRVDMEWCCETFPYQHAIWIGGKRVLMRAPEIRKLLREHGLPVPKHFTSIW